MIIDPLKIHQLLLNQATIFAALTHITNQLERQSHSSNTGDVVKALTDASMSTMEVLKL